MPEFDLRESLEGLEVGWEKSPSLCSQAMQALHVDGSVYVLKVSCSHVDCGQYLVQDYSCACLKFSLKRLVGSDLWCLVYGCFDLW